MRYDVIIAGAGHNGLTAAFYLSKMGLKVLIVEARNIIGGACVTEELIPGYRFSTCANVACWLRPKIAEDLQLLERGVQFWGYDCSTQVMAGGETFTSGGGARTMQEEIARFSKADAEAWPKWNAFWRVTSDVLGPYLMTPPPTLGELFARAREMGAEEILTTVLTTSIAQLADRFFESDVMRNLHHAPHDMGSVYDTGTGIARALATAMSSYSETGKPAPRGYVRGGMGELTKAMAQAAQELGTTIRTNSPVQRILVEDGKAVGVELVGGEQIEAGIVVSNADPKRTFLSMVEAKNLDLAFRHKVQQLRTDIAPLKFHCTLSELPEFYGYEGSELPTRGTFNICPDREYHENAWDDARHGRLPRAPFMSIMTPTAQDDSLAPAGKHTMSVWILFAPVHLREGTWPERREEMARRLITQISKYSPNFRNALQDYVLLTPHDLQTRVLLTDGNIHHVDISPSQMLWQRPMPELAHYRSPITKLYLCGAGMHPYGEVHGVCGHNAAQTILADLAA
jgi:phytoene dehydrogenase-like protein